MTVLDVIGRGRPSALRKADLARRLGTTTRAVEAEIQRLRLDGRPILSDESGYWLETDPSEVKRCADRLHRRAVHQLETSTALLRTADRLAANPRPVFGQPLPSLRRGA